MAGLYIHIPFCHSKCAYCDFYSMPRTDHIDDYVRAVTLEWNLRRHETSEPINTIYLGGGTPSILSPEQLSRITRAIPTDGIIEYTIEANPEDITTDKAKTWLDSGIRRVSMGIQSLDDNCLKIVGRRHSAHEALHAVEVLRTAGYTNISLDVMYGLPGQSIDSWKDTLHRILSYAPEHLSAYALSIEHGTRLYAAVSAGKVRPADDETYIAMYDILCAETAAAGYEHYEISNFALPGFRAIHNSHYWDMTPYIGLGPGAHSWDGNTRRINPSDLSAYIAAIDSGNVACKIEAENDIDRLNDMIFTSMRTIDGLKIDLLPEPYRAQFVKTAQQFADDIVFADRRIRIRPQSWMISDSIIRELLIDNQS